MTIKIEELKKFQGSNVTVTLNGGRGDFMGFIYQQEEGSSRFMARNSMMGNRYFCCEEVVAVKNHRLEADWPRTTEAQAQQEDKYLDLLLAFAQAFHQIGYYDEGGSSQRDYIVNEVSPRLAALEAHIEASK